MSGATLASYASSPRRRFSTEPGGILAKSLAAGRSDRPGNLWADRTPAWYRWSCGSSACDQDRPGYCPHLFHRSQARSLSHAAACAGELGYGRTSFPYTQRTASPMARWRIMYASVHRGMLWMRRPGSRYIIAVSAPRLPRRREPRRPQRQSNQYNSFGQSMGT